MSAIDSEVLDFMEYLNKTGHYIMVETWKRYLPILRSIINDELHPCLTRIDKHTISFITKEFTLSIFFYNVSMKVYTMKISNFSKEHLLKIPRTVTFMYALFMGDKGL